MNHNHHQNPISEDQNAAKPPGGRVGKIARLPLDLRNLVNHALRDGCPYADIIARLKTQGYDGFNRSNFHRWRRGGYRQWLAEQQRFQQAHRLSDLTAALLGQIQPGVPSDLADAGELLVAAQFCHLLESFDTETIADDPEPYLRVAKIFTGYMAARAQRQRAEVERHKQKLELRKNQSDAEKCPQAVTPETLQQVARDLRII